METAERYAFGGFVLDIGERRLLHEDRAIALAPKIFDLLVALVRRPDRLLNKRELLDAVWPDAFVEEGILSVHVSALRKALNDTADPPTYIETVRGAGYRFIAKVAVPRSADSILSAARLIGLPDALTPQARAKVHELCGIGRSHLQSASMSEVPKAVDAFRAAIEIDPGYAAAHAGLALAHCARASMRLAPPADAYQEAKVSALRALALSQTSADAQVALGTVLFLSEWDWIGAERSLCRALELNPDHQQGLLIYGRLLDARGRHEEALAIKLRALDADPRSPLVHIQIALSYWNRRDYDSAIHWAEKALATDPNHLLAREFLTGAYIQKGQHDRAMAEGLRHAECAGASSEALRPLREAYASGGRQAVLQLAIEQLKRAGAPPFHLAALSAEGGDIDAAFTYLDRAIDGHDPSLVDLAVAPQWDGLRHDPRFAACLIRVGL